MQEPGQELDLLHGLIFSFEVVEIQSKQLSLKIIFKADCKDIFDIEINKHEIRRFSS